LKRNILKTGTIIKTATVIISLLLIIYLGNKIYSMVLYEVLYERVAPNITYRGLEVGGYKREEISKIVKHLAPRDNINPVNAKIDWKNKRIIPEINGREVAVEETINKVLNAESAENCEPVFIEISPQIKWNDYPTLPASQGNPEKNSVSFMINVAWGEEHLRDVKKVLDKNGVKATFFVTGKWAKTNPERIKNIHKAEHELANHGYSDAEVMTELDWNSTVESLSKTNQVIKNVAGVKPKYFSPHKGEFKEATLEAVYRESMKTVLWSLDTVDWMKPGIEKMERKIKENVNEGDIILMHPTEDIAELLSRIIPYIKEEKGLNIEPIQKHLSPEIINK